MTRVRCEQRDCQFNEDGECTSPEIIICSSDQDVPWCGRVELNEEPKKENTLGQLLRDIRGGES